MQILTRLLKRPGSDDTSAIVNSLIYLRLLVLAVATGLMVLADAYYENLRSGVGMAVIVLAVALWSGMVLGTDIFSRTKLATVREIFIDFAWVFGLVLLSGRSANPFIYYYLVLIAICASILSVRAAWMFCVGGIVAYTSLMVMDMGAHFGHMAERYRVHLAGMWLNYVGSSVLTCYFISRLANMIRTQHTQLSAAREENLKNEQLIGIGTVAASTVHSLATPLSTLTVLAEDMASSGAVEPGLREDLALMLTQINRCKQTMKNLATLAEGWSSAGALSAAGLKSELEEYYSLNSPASIPRFVLTEGAVECRVASNLLLQHALINLINNANESEGAPVQVIFARRGQLLDITITNATAVAPENVFQRWGKPQSSEKQTGLGIGSFLANSTIEKLGGTVQLQAEPHNKIPGYTRIEVTVSLPLEKQ